MIKGVIFDMDGVMIDTERQSNNGWLKAAEQQGEVMPVWLIDTFKGATMEANKREFDKFFNGRIDYYKTRQLRTDYVMELRRAEGIPVKKGLYKLLEYLEKNQIPCAVATSTRRESAERTLHETGVYSYLKTVVYGDEVTNGKPAPDIFLKAAEGLDASANECIVIEDSINGIKAGWAAGANVIYIPDTITIDENTKKMISAECRDLSEVIGTIEALNGKELNIDKNIVTKAFERYVMSYNPENAKIRLKIQHTMRVAMLCEQIAMQEGMSEYDTQVAWLSGILHDIGRFEQVRRYGTFVDAESVNHGELAADILFRYGVIESFIPEIVSYRGLRDWNVLENAVRYHNSYRLPENLSPREKKFAWILRDADKIDIIKVCVEDEPEAVYGVSADVLRSTPVTPEVMAEFNKEQVVLKSLKRTPADSVVGHISLVYELVYPQSVEIVMCQGYIDKMLNFESALEEVNKQFIHIREKMNNYMQKRLSDCQNIF